MIFMILFEIHNPKPVPPNDLEEAFLIFGFTDQNEFEQKV
jgi:hypothetical protein